MPVRTIRETIERYMVQAGYEGDDLDQMVQIGLDLYAVMSGVPVEVVADAIIVSANSVRGPRVLQVIIDEGD